MQQTRSTTPVRPQAGTSAVVSAQSVSKTFTVGEEQIHALRQVTLTIAPGSFTAIMGPSGSGKSTLLQCLATLTKPTSGTVVFDGKDTSVLSDGKLSALRRNHMGFIFQAYNLVEVLTVRENIEFPSRLAGKKISLAEVNSVCDRIGIRDRMRHVPSELSGGQQQRVAIARAMVGSPQVIFADEPTGALDVKTSKSVLRLLRQCVAQGQTVVLVTHDVAAARAADRVVVLIDGVIAHDVTAPGPHHFESIQALLEDRS